MQNYCGFLKCKKYSVHKVRLIVHFRYYKMFFKWLIGIGEYSIPFAKEALSDIILFQICLDYLMHQMVSVFFFIQINYSNYFLRFIKFGFMCIFCCGVSMYKMITNKYLFDYCFLKVVIFVVVV